jgi:hypothetical protein
MSKKSVIDRIILLATSLLAAYQIINGVDGLPAVPMVSYTIAFGVTLVAALLLIIFGLQALESPLVVVVSTIIPLSLSLGLVWEYLVAWRIPYLLFVILGFLLVAATRLTRPAKDPTGGKSAVYVLALVHGVAGLIIFILPLVLSISGLAKPGFAMVGVGGALIDLGGLLLSFLKVGQPILSREMILNVLPGLLLLMTTAFVIGFSFA